MDEDDLPADFDGLQYIASYGDLITAFGDNPEAGRQHYLAFGQTEGRETDSFDEQQYLANYGDLRSVYGEGDEAGRAATVQYIQFGAEQGRTDTAPPEDFDALQYLASNGDLITAFGADRGAALEHYIVAGQFEGREIDSFDEGQYLENYADLQAAFAGLDDDAAGEAATEHFVQYGFAQGRVDDPLPADTTALDFLV